MRKIIYLLVLIYMGFSVEAFAINQYNLERNCPLGKYDGITANFGQFRNTTGSYKIHDGIDYRASIGTKVYSLHGGTVTVGDDDGWGSYVIVTNSSGAFATRYAHLSKILVKNGDSIGANTLIGLSGNTGKSTGPHLHFGLGPSVINDGEVNPIVAGLRQGSYGNPEISSISYKHTSVSKTDEYIIYYDENSSKKVDISATFRPLKIVAEAYQSANYRTNPYKVEFIVTKHGDTNYRQSKIIEFDDLNFEVTNYYRTVAPYKTYFTGEDYKNFFYMDWTPESSGTYEIEVKAYVAHWENNRLVYPDVSMKRKIYIADALYDALDPEGIYAWQPTEAEISASGVVRAAAVEWPKPRYVTDLSNTVFTTNTIDVSPDFQKYTEFTVAAARATDWTIRIKDLSGVEKYKIEKKGMAEGVIKWDGSGVSEGKYRYEIEAKDPLTGVKATKSGISYITIDNTKPGLLANWTSGFPTKMSITSTSESTSVQFQPQEDLYSVGVNIVDAANHDNKTITGLGWSPSLKQGETFTVVWEGAGHYPEGAYQFEVIMTDLAGNINKVYSNPFIVNVSGSYIPSREIFESLPIPYFKYRGLALDGEGNVYITGKGLNKVLKYDKNGQNILREYAVGAVEGLAGDGARIYMTEGGVASTSPRLRALNYETGEQDAGFRGVVSPGALVEKIRYNRYSEGGFLFVKWVEENRDEIFYYYAPDESFDQPKDITVDSKGNVYVADSGEHRILRYSKSAEPQVFEATKITRKTDYPSFRPYIGRREDYTEWTYWYNGLNIKEGTIKNADGSTTTIFVRNPGTADGQFYIPTSIAIDKDDSFYVADTGNNRIQKFKSDGSFISKFAEGRLNSPQGIAVDEYGNVWVADTGNHRIVQFNAVGDFVKEYRSDEYEINPQKIAVKNGKLYIADANHDKPLIWNVAGALSDIRLSDEWFSPNADNIKDAATITYSISQPASITIQVINSTGEVVGNVLDKAPRDLGPHKETWNGQITTSSGTQLTSDGNYILKVIAYFGDYVKSKTAQIHVDTRAPTVSLSSTERAISPNNDGVKDSTQFIYQIADNLAPQAEAKFLQYKNNKLTNILWDEGAWERWGKLGEPMASVWNGKIGTIQAVSQGKYICKLQATDLAGNTGTATCEVIVDITPPRLENAAVDNPYFSPNNDGRKDAANLSFVLNDNIFEEVKLTAKVVDSSGREILILKNEETLNRGEKNLVWDGFSISGSPETLVPDGLYKFKLWAKDEAGNLGTCDPIEVVVDTIPPEIRGLTAAPNPFTPNDDGIKDTTAFTYTLSEPCYTNLKIFREDGALFRSRGKYNITEDSYTWDGKGARGELLGGTYSYFLYAEDRAANTSTSEAKTIVVDREPSLIPYCYAEPDPFSPINPWNNYTEVKYWVSRNNVQVQVAVLGREGQIIKNLVFGETQNKGEHTARWVGDFVSGYGGPRSSRDPNKVADGAYEFKIWANDPYNDARGENNNTVLVDNTPPYVALYPVEIDQVRKRATLRYYLPENSKVDIAAYDSGGGLVERLITSEAQDAGEYYMPWNIGSRPMGRTYFTVAAEDSAKNRDEKTTEIFSVNPEQVLTLADLSASPNPFTPNSDGLKDQTRITYRVSGGVSGYRVNINILNSIGSTVRRLVINEPQNQGAYNFYWDGRNDSSDPTVITYAPDGLYTYQIIAEDRLGARVESTGSLTLVSTKPTVNISVSPIYISPNGDGIADTALITYSINYPTFWIDNPAQVKLDIISASGEAVFTRTFTQTPGTYSYTWNVRDGGDYGPKTTDVPAGTYYVFANATDALGTSALPKSVLFYVDYTMPAPSNFTITPLYAKLGSLVSINLSFDEPLAETPSVNLVHSNGIIRSAIMEPRSLSAGPNDYRYSYIITADDPEGLTTVRVEARDLSLNPIIRTQTFTIDKTNPVISNISFSPNPAKVGDAHIDFRVNEDTSSAAVKVAQNGTDWNYATVADLGGGNYRATHKVFSGYDGPATTTIEVTDLAENLSTHQPIGLVIDTIAPTFSGISCEVNNLDFSKYAKEGSEVTINFKSSESLQFNSEVRVNSRLATYFSQIGNEYSYKYTVRNDDPEGLSEISISGYDPAGNLGDKTTSSASESFTTDLTNPTVAIASPGSGDIIASPSPFFTNADPSDASDRPNYTTLRYETSENGFVTLKVHKVSNDLIAYTRDNFTENNRVATLANNVLMGGGVHNTEWRGQTTVASFDANGDGYVDPGKYAFIVEVRDRAGNVTQRKWGGTVWIQNNVLQLIQPETVGINPDPLNFSPNTATGNSPNTTTKFWFKVKLGISPAAPADPERIEAMGLPDDFRWLEGVVKKVGTYTIKVYDSTGNWIRTIEKDSPMYSATDTFVIWDGKTGTGPDKLSPDTYVVDGDYKLVVDVKDFAGNPAYGNLLERWVKADSTLPTVTNNQPGDDTWRNSAGTTYNVDLSDSGSKLQEAAYRIRRPDGSYTDWIALPVVNGSSTFTNDWAVEFSDTYCQQGKNYISVRVEDIAGNERIVDDVFYVKKDTLPPTDPSISIDQGAYTNSRSVTLTTSAIDSQSEVAETWVKNDGGSYAQLSGTGWTLNDSDGTRTVYAKFRDAAGNWSAEVNATITLDRTAPSIAITPPSGGPFNPYLAAFAAFGQSFSVTDGLSGVSSVSTQIEKSDGTLVKTLTTNNLGSGNYSISWNGTNNAGDYVNEGGYKLKISATDNAGNTKTLNSTEMPIITISDDQRISSSWRLTSYVDANNPDLSYSNGNYHLVWNAPRSAGGLQSIYYRKSNNGGRDWGSNVLLDPEEADRHYELPSVFAEGSNIHVAWSRRNSADAQDLHLRYRKSSNNGDSWGGVTTVSHLPSVKPRYPSVTARSGWVYITAHEQYTSMYEVYLYRSSDGGTTWAEGTGIRITNESRRSWYPDLAANGSNIHLIWNQDQMDTGYTRLQYCRSTDANGASWGSIRNITLTAYSFLPYLKIAENGSNIHIVLQGGRYAGDGAIEYLKSTDNGDNWAKTNFPYAGEPTIAVSGNNIHIVYTNNSGVFYRRSIDNGSSWSSIIKISNSSFASAPRIVANGADAYVIWRDKSPNNNYEIYGQKIPSNFAPVNGTVTATMVKVPATTIDTTKAQSLAKPALLEPKDGSTITNTIRPIFKWQGVSGITDYKVQLNKDSDAFLIPTRNLSKIVPQSQSNQAIAYAIHEFDDGLAAGQWYWRVLAISGTQEAESDHWSFTIDPALSITGITNYPNPFNPNRERTSIRYRLGREADEVKIRIYDITGALVNELEGSTQGESVNIWSKYNDIYWDGTNGRGDKVLNGIYPFEVVARVGDRSVSGRGKIAILK